MANKLVERVYAAKEDMDLADSLIKDYLPFIKSITSKAIGNKPVNDNDDELSIAMIAFHEAIVSYSRFKGAFLKYTSVIIKNKLIDYHRKETKHSNVSSIDRTVNEEDDTSLIETIEDERDMYSEYDVKEATKKELIELKDQLKDFDLTINDVVKSCPKQARTLSSCYKAINYAVSNPEVIDTMKRTKKIPLSQIVTGTGVERKVIERHRKYIVVLMLVYSNGYELIREHLNQVMASYKGGGQR